MASHRPRVGVFAGSGPVHPEQLSAGLRVLEKAELTVVLSPGLTERQGFLAGSDEDRITRIHNLLDRQDVDILIAARGGYGLNRIVSRLDMERFRQTQKLVVGFSDVTALHTQLLSTGLRGIHGPVVTQLARLPPDHLTMLVQTMTGAPPPLQAKGPVIVDGVAEGPLWGGNLAVFSALIGTPALQLPSHGFLLLLEDVGETTYRIDRLLTQLEMAGVLSRASGIILGDFAACCPAQADHQTLAEVLEERLGRLSIPVLAGAPIGHAHQNHPVVLGAPHRLSTYDRTLIPL
ncbi:MAG: LD-carboxypeptidase [Myxococcales bacterium]|nr:LD-carboxypeptidase [Myxococcales bacterium]